jgi:hypothetical protein
MISLRTQNYAIPPDGHFWSWSAGHEAVEWADGRTLALWPEVHAVLEFLGSDDGLPPLGAVLLLLSACREEWISQRPDNHAAVRKAMGIPAGDAIPPEIAEVLITGLDAIHDLPKDLRASLSAKCHLVSMLFSGGPYCLPREESAQVLRDLALFGSKRTIEGKPELKAKARMYRDLRALRTGLARHDAASLESLLRTGLEDSQLQTPPLPETNSLDADPRLLLDQLVRSGGESGAAAAVAKRMIAMMNFPGRFGTPRDLPVGGISDITNRGTIDRLLPGELAWDDMVLAARLVHHEALYFRREIPPQHVAVSHTVLLDRGLRLWGTARVFSLGVALGLWHHPALNGPGETFECAAAVADGFEYLDLSKPAGVRAALETLVPAASPDAFLTAWWDAAQIVEDSAIPELSFVTVPEHLDGGDTRQLLGEIAAWIHQRGGHFRVIAINRLGSLEMQSWSPGGVRTILRGEINLAEILSPPAAEESSRKITPPPLRTQPDRLAKLLPIYSLESLPFLFPVAPQASAYLPELGIGISIDHRLLRWPKPGWGGWELLSVIPGRQHWLGQDDRGEVIVIAAAEQPGESARVFRYEKRALHEIEIEPSLHAFPRHATVSGGAVVLAYGSAVEALSLSSGRRLAQQSIAKLPPSPVLTFDGEKITVLESDKKVGFTDEGWSFRDDTWPRIISPSAVTLDGGILRVLVGGQVFRFDAMQLTWAPENRTGVRFHEFKDAPFMAGPEITLKIARPMPHREVWLDPRGLLHLKDTRHDSSTVWSILMSAPSSSAWQGQWGHFSREARLRAPSEPDSGDFRPRILQGFFNAIQGDPSASR